MDLPALVRAQRISYRFCRFSQNSGVFNGSSFRSRLRAQNRRQASAIATQAKEIAGLRREVKRLSRR